MRAPFAAVALVALALPTILAGCTLETPPPPVPMVLLEEHLTLSPPVAELLERARPACSGGRYSLDPPVAVVHHATRGLPDFVVVLDSTTTPDVDGGRAFTPTAASGDGSAWDWTVRATFGNAGGSSAFGFGTPFRDGPPDELRVAWRDGRAWLDDAPLEKGVPVERRFDYDVAGPDGGPVHVVHEWRATYLGHGFIVEEPRACDERGPKLDA